MARSLGSLGPRQHLVPLVGLAHQKPGVGAGGVGGEVRALSLDPAVPELPLCHPVPPPAARIIGATAWMQKN